MKEFDGRISELYSLSLTIYSILGSFWHVARDMSIVIVTKLFQLDKPNCPCQSSNRERNDKLTMSSCLCAILSPKKYYNQGRLGQN